MKDILLLGGILSPLIYIVATIVGGSLRSGYSHIKDTVSELFAPGSPNKKLLNRFILSSALLTVAFGVGMWQFVSESGLSTSIGVIASIFMILMGLINIVTGLIFLQDPMGQPMTFSGKMHIGLVAVLAILSMVTPFLFGLWLINSDLSSDLGVYSLLTSGVILVSGLSSLVVTKLEKPYLGLFERLTIFLFLQWSVVIAVSLITL